MDEQLKLNAAQQMMGLRRQRDAALARNNVLEQENQFLRQKLKERELVQANCETEEASDDRDAQAELATLRAAYTRLATRRVALAKKCYLLSDALGKSNESNRLLHQDLIRLSGAHATVSGTLTRWVHPEGVQHSDYSLPRPGPASSETSTPQGTEQATPQETPPVMPHADSEVPAKANPPKLPVQPSIRRTIYPPEPRQE